MQIEDKYSSKGKEDAVYSLWIKNRCFSAQPDSNKKPFTIVIPPPNITGILHMGHALNDTIQDVLVRFKRMRGFEALWMPGTDHAGIATQNVVEKQLAREGLRKEDVGREEFTKKLWQWRDKYGSTIIEQLKKMGASCDWERLRFTMDDEYSEAVKEAFIRLYNKGLIYQGNYIINWCPRCKTALSDEESPHSDVKGYLYYIRYPLKSRGESKGREYVVVATTRPETMLGDTAVAINPHDERYNYLKGREIILPIMNRTLKVIEDELVELDFGTGVVKVTPAHDPVDFTLGKKHNLEFINIMDENAVMNENAGEFAGLNRFKAREAVIERLKKEGLIEKIDPYNVRAGRCYRCNTIIEPRLSKQWFVRMKPLSKKAIEAVESGKIKFYPSRWKKVYLNWMNNIQDWCISRQIWWGHKLPVYYCRKCQSQVTSHKSQASSSNPGDWSLKPEAGIIVSKTKPKKCPVCGSTDIYQETDVLDTWFSSWLWPFAAFYWPFTSPKPQAPGHKDENKNIQPEAYSLRQEEFDYFYPTDVLVTASEILFFWVARMIMSALEFTGKIPFHTVLIHGTVRDDKGVKMSKSLGNTIDPLDIIDKFGADALRFSLMMLASTGADVYLTENKFLVGRNFANKIWNASRFIITSIDNTGINIGNLSIDSLDSVDYWFINNLNRAICDITGYLDNYRINDAVKRVYDFFWHIFCDWYIEIVKREFASKNAEGKPDLSDASFKETDLTAYGRAENKAKVLLLGLVASLKLIHPVMPFITEEIFQILKTKFPIFEEENIVKAKWPENININSRGIDLSACDAQADMDNIEWLINLVKEVRNLKIDLGIVPSKKVKVLITADKDTESLVAQNKEWVTRLSNLEDIEITSKLDRILSKDNRISLDFVLDNFNVENYIISLDNKIGKLENVLAGLSKKLNNKNFMSRASKEIVEREKAKYESDLTAVRRFRKLKDALSR